MKSISSQRASMPKPQRSFARLRRVLTASVLSLFCLLNSLPVTVVAQSELPATEWSLPSLPESTASSEGETWFATWTATAEGHLDGPYGDDGRIIRTRKISMQGSGISRYSEENPGTGWLTKPFQWTVIDDLFEQTTEPCHGGGSSISRERQSITNPTEDPVWVDSFLIPDSIITRDDGSNYMPGLVCAQYGWYAVVQIPR